MSCFYISEIKRCQLPCLQIFSPILPFLAYRCPQGETHTARVSTTCPAGPAFGALLPLRRPTTPAVSRVSPAPGPLHVLVLTEGFSQVGYLLFTPQLSVQPRGLKGGTWRVSRAHSHSVFRKTARLVRTAVSQRGVQQESLLAQPLCPDVGSGFPSLWLLGVGSTAARAWGLTMLFSRFSWASSSFSV